MSSHTVKRIVFAPHLSRFITTSVSVAILFLVVLPVTAQQVGGDSFVTADLDVRSTPAGATVSINGRTVGTTPLTVSHIRPGRRRVRVAYRGYSAVEQWVDIPAGDTIELMYELQPLRGVVQLTTNAETPLEAYLNGEWQQVSELRIFPGTHLIQFRAFGYHPQRESVSIFPAATGANEDQSVSPSAPSAVFVRLEQVETPAVRITDISAPVRTSGGALQSPLIVELETDAPVSVRVEILDDQGNTTYAGVEELDSRSNHITWDGMTAGFDTYPDGEYTLLLRGETLQLAETPLTRTFSILSRRERKGNIVWRNGRGTPLFPLPVAPSHPQFVATVGGGSRYTKRDTAEWSVPAHFRTGATLFQTVVLSVSGELAVGAKSTEPAGTVTGSIGTVQIAPSDLVSMAANVAITASEITSGSVAESALRGDVPLIIKLGPTRIAAVPGMKIETGSNDTSVDRVIPVVGGAITADYRASRVTISAETRWNGSELRSTDVRQRYAVDFAYIPTASPIAIYAACVLDTYRSGFSAGGEAGIAFSIR